MRLEVTEKREFLAYVEATSSFVDKIKEKSFYDEKLSQIFYMVLRGETGEIVIDWEGVFRIKGRVYVPCVDDFTQSNLVEANSLSYYKYLCATKMY